MKQIHLHKQNAVSSTKEYSKANLPLSLPPQFVNLIYQVYSLALHSQNIIKATTLQTIY